MLFCHFVWFQEGVGRSCVQNNIFNLHTQNISGSTPTELNLVACGDGAIGLFNEGDHKLIYLMSCYWAVVVFLLCVCCFFFKKSMFLKPRIAVQKKSE